MRIYIIAALILVILSAVEVFSEKFQKKTSLKIYYAAIGSLALIFMTRWFVGWDWYNYYPDYHGQTSNFELGYRFFAQGVRKISEEYQLFVALNSLIDFLILGWIIPKYSRYPLMTLFLYLGVNGLALETDIMRNVKSVLLFLISIQFIEKKKFLPYLLLNILGATFHITALLYLPLYFILGERYSRKAVMGIFLLGNIVYFSNIMYLKEIIDHIELGRFQGYITLIDNGKTKGVDLFYLERVLFFFTAYFGGEVISQENLRRYRIFENSAYIGIFIFLFLSELSVIAIRLALLFSFAYWFIFTLILENREIKRWLRIGIFSAAMGISLFRGINFLSFEGNRKVYRYENYFSEEKSRLEDKIQVIKEGKKYREEGKKRELLILY